MSAPSSGTQTFHMIKAVAGRLEGGPRQLRRRSSGEFKAQVVTEALEPGTSVSAIARRSAFTRRICLPGAVMLGPSGIIACGTRVARVWWGLGRRSDRDCHWRGRRACRRGLRRGALAAGDPGGAFGMIPSGVKVFLASHPVDFRQLSRIFRTLIRRRLRLQRVVVDRAVACSCSIWSATPFRQCAAAGPPPSYDRIDHRGRRRRYGFVAGSPS